MAERSIFYNLSGSVYLDERVDLPAIKFEEGGTDMLPLSRRRLRIFTSLALIGVLSPAFAVAQQKPTFTDADKAAIEQMLDRYARAFSTKDYATLRETLQAPFVNFPGGFSVTQTLDELMKSYISLREQQPAEYDHSSWGQSTLIVLSPERALFDRMWRRYRKDGSVSLESAGVYVVSKSSGSWKLCGVFNRDKNEFGKTR
jgi:hypothetical protein